MAATSTQSSTIINNFKFWEDFSLTEKKQSLMNQVNEINTNQELLLPARQQLSQENKDFAKLDAQKKLSSFRDLIKSYQKEIDRLTKTARFAEDAFRDLVRELADAPDPKEILKQLKSEEQSKSENRDSKLKLENEKLRRELEEFRRDYKEIKNQEVTIRNLEEQLRQQKTKMNDLIQKQVDEKELSLREENQSKLDKLNEQQDSLKRQLKSTKSELTEAVEHNNILQTQLTDVKKKYDKELSAKRAEIDMVSNEIERTNSVYQELLIKFNDLNRSNEPLDKPTLNWELEMVQKDMEITKLRDIITTNKEEEERNQNESKKTILRLQSELDKQNSKIQLFQSQLSKIPDQDYVTKLENKVKVLEALCGNYVREEELEGQSVEAALRNKNRILSSEIVTLKSELSVVSNRLTLFQSKTVELEQEIQQKKDMLNKWESDFDQLRHIDSNDPHEAINTSDSNTIKMIWEQRDRFKNKIHDIETENRSLEQKFKASEIQIKSLKNDNIKLYEKIRYLQTYGQISAEAITDLESAHSSDTVESRYKDMYEASVNPFVVFNKKVKNERYKSLNPAEKLILSTTQFFLSTKQTRLFLFAYLVFLHFLVFSTLWKMVHTVSDINCNNPDNLNTNGTF